MPVVDLGEFTRLLPGLVNEMARSVQGVRRLLANYIVRLRPRDCSDCVDAAVDSAFPRSPVELVGLGLAPIAVAYAVSGPRPAKGVKRLVYYSSEDSVPPERVSLEARIAERRVLLEIIEQYRPVSVLIDGEICPARLARESSELANLCRAVLDRCARRGITVIGVVKRSRTSYLRRLIGVSAHDKAVASYALAPCEAVVIDHPGTLLNSYGCKIVLYKPPRGLAAAVRVELCGRLDDLARHACEPGWSGLPWLADLVDGIAKREADRMISLLEAKVKTLLGGVGVAELALPLNPQEGSRRARRSEQSL